MNKILLSLFLTLISFVTHSQSYQIVNNLACPTDRTKSGIALVVEPNGTNFKFYLVKHTAGNCNINPTDQFLTNTEWKLYNTKGDLIARNNTRANNGYSEAIFLAPNFTESQQNFYATIESASLRTESTVVIKYNAPLNRPTLSSPSQNQELPFGTTNHTFSWQGNNTNVTYVLKIRDITTGDNGPILFEQNVGNVNQRNVSGLTSGNKYRWVVTAVSSNSQAESGEGLFSVKNGGVTLSRPTLSSPSQNQELPFGTTNHTFSWQGNNTNVTYVLKIRDITSGDNGPILFEQNVGNVSQRNVSGLINGNKYRWVVTAVSSNSQAESGEGLFSVKNGGVTLSRPTLSSPSQNQELPFGTTSHTFSWQGNNTNATFVLRIRDITTGDNGPILFEQNVGSVNQRNVSGLTSGNKYRWVVTAVSSNSQAESGEGLFSVKNVDPLKMPTLSSPTQNQELSFGNTNWMFTWQGNNINATYILKIRDVTDGDNGPIIFEQNVGNTNQKSVSGLVDSRKYRWIVRAIGTISEAESEIGYFTTEEKLNPPILILPTNNFSYEHTQKEVILNWNKNNKSINITYFITVFDYENNVNLLENKNIGQNVESFKLDGLKIGNQYSWQIKVTKNAQTATSEKFIFKVKLAPPSITAPAQNRLFSKSTKDFTIKWDAFENPKNVDYNINMRDKFTNELIYNYYKTGTDKFSFTAENIKEGREYQFVIQAKNRWTENESAIHKVSIQSEVNPVLAVNLKDPINGKVYAEVPNSITLNWDNPNPSNSVKLFLRLRDVTTSEPNGELLFDNFKVSSNSYTVDGSKLKVGHRYKWNVSTIPSEYEDIPVGENFPFYLVKSATFEFKINEENANQEISHSAEFGKTLGGFNHLNPSNPVVVYSNGDNPAYFSNINHYLNDGYYAGKKWQCVEYVNRYYYLVYGLRLTEKFRGNADQFYDNATKLGLDYFPNNGSHRPKVGDILCFTNSTNGHIGIIKEVNSDYIILVSQNLGKLDHLNLKINFENKVLKTASISGKIQGWLTLFPETQKVTPNLVLNSIDGTDNLVQGSPFNFTARLTNNGNETFKGKIVLEILDQNKQPISDLTNADLIYELGKGAGLNLNHQKDNLQSVGIKYLQVKYYNGDSWVVIPGTENPKRIVINGKTNDDTDLKLTSFLGGQELTIGKSYPITWTSKGDVGGINIYYTTDFGKTFDVITKGAPNNGKFLWTLPNNIENGIFKLKIESENYNSLYDISTGVFTIKSDFPPNYQFLAPLKNEVVKIGETYKIRWNSQYIKTRINIYIINALIKRSLISDLDDTGSFDWEVFQDFKPGFYQVIIESVSNSSVKSYSETIELRNETVSQLVLTNSIIATIKDGFILDADASFKNIGSAAWTGCLFLTIHEKGNTEKFVEDIALSNSVSLAKDEIYKLTKSNFKYGQIKDGNYEIHAKISEGCRNNNYRTLFKQSFVKLSAESNVVKIEVTSPKKGEIIYATPGKKYRIEWQANKPIYKPTVSLALNGKDFVPLANGTQTTNFGFLEFDPSGITFPNGPYKNAIIKVEYGNFSGVSGIFTITPNANLNNIKITSPIENSEITGTSIDVVWTANQATEKVNIFFSYDNITWAKSNAVPILASLGNYKMEKLNLNSENFYVKVQDALVPNNNSTVKLRTPKQVTAENSITGTLWNIIVDATNEQVFIETPNFPSSTKVSLFYKGELIAAKPIPDGNINFTNLDKNKVYTIVFEDIELGLSYSYSLKPTVKSIKYQFPVGLRKKISEYIEILENYSYSTKSIVSQYYDPRYDSGNTENFSELGNEFNFVHNYNFSNLNTILRERLVLENEEINNEIEKRLFLVLNSLSLFTNNYITSTANSAIILKQIVSKAISAVFTLSSFGDDYSNNNNVANTIEALTNPTSALKDKVAEATTVSLGTLYFELICKSQWQKGIVKLKNSIKFEHSDDFFDIISTSIENAICNNESYKLRLDIIDNEYVNNVSASGKDMFHNFLEGIIEETTSLITQRIAQEIFFIEYTTLVQSIINESIYENYKKKRYSGTTTNAIEQYSVLLNEATNFEYNILECRVKIKDLCFFGLIPEIIADNSNLRKVFRSTLDVGADVLLGLSKTLKNPTAFTASIILDVTNKAYDVVDFVKLTTLYFPASIKSNNIWKSIPDIVNTIFFPGNNSIVSGNSNNNPLDIIMYPNPNDGVFRIDKGDTELKFEIYTKEGVFKESSFDSDETHYIFNIKNLPPDTYILRINNGKEIKTKRIVKY